MKSPNSKVSQTATEIIKWFFHQGKDRPNDYRLGMGMWLRSLFDLRRESKITEEELSSSKKSLAIWGPSQAGKSTLFAKYVDKNAEPDGRNSAMQWAESSPIRFTKDAEKSPDDCLTWNPYTYGHDASACITRFTLREEVPEPDFPVEITLATQEQLIHAISVGYLSECKLDDKKPKRFWDDDSIIKELEEKCGKKGEPQENAYEKLFETVSLLKLMTELKFDRYCGIGDFTLAQILERSPSLTDEEKILEFVQEVFWDSAPPLNELLQKLQGANQRLKSLKPSEGASIHCSYEVARLINDMAAYSRMVGGTDSRGDTLPTDEETKKQIKRISCESRNGRLLIGFDLQQKLILEDRDFALIQGIVWEITAPLRKEILARHQPSVLHDLLEQTDLLDFPGVAKGGNLAGEDRLAMESLTKPEGQHLLFSTILKRGKTASVAISSGLESKIDGFSILAKVDEHIANPDQISRGIRVWWKTATGTEISDAKSPELPLNLVLTFFGDLINKVIVDPLNPNLSQAFEKFKPIGVLLRPEITKIFATHYFNFKGFYHEQADRPAARAEIQKAKEAIEKEETVIRLFDKNPSSVQEVFKHPKAENPEEKGDGGVDYFLSELTKQAVSSNRRSLLESRNQKELERLKNLLEEACPSGGEEDLLRQKRIRSWSEKINKILLDDFTGSATKNTGAAIRKLFAMNPNRLKRVPLKIKAKSIDPRGYLRDQLSRWRNEKENFGRLSDLGLSTSNELGQMLRYFTESVDFNETAKWVINNFGNLKETQLAKIARRYVAIRLADELSGRANLQNVTHTDTTKARELLVRNSEENASFHYENAPHFQMIIDPFLKHLDHVAESPGQGRPSLPGDEYLREFDLSNGNKEEITSEGEEDMPDDTEEMD